MRKEQNQTQLGRCVKIVKDFPNRAKFEKKDRAGSVEKVKNGDFHKICLKRPEGGGLTEKGGKSSTLAAICVSWVRFSQPGKNLKKRHVR